VTALILGGLIAVAAVVIVSLPFLRESSEPELIDAGGETEELLGLLETRDRSLAALKELEFDHRTGKVDDIDYRALVGPLRRQAAQALQALDARTGRSDGLGDREHVEGGDDDGRHRGRGRRRHAAVDERPHHVTAGGEPDERDERERDAEGKSDL
jgi:hypothetical protein